MFGMLWRKAEPVGPFEFETCIEIGLPAAEIYPLLDWGDVRNAKRALGNKVEQIGATPDRYRMALDLVPGHVFEMSVSEAVPGEAYAFGTRITPPVGRLVSSSEAYEIEPLSERACRLNLTVSANFLGGLSDETLAMEVMMMATACENALAKLKVQAERGVDAVHAIEAIQME